MTLQEVTQSLLHGIPVSQADFAAWFASPEGYNRPYQGEDQQAVMSGLGAQSQQAMAKDSSIDPGVLFALGGFGGVAGPAIYGGLGATGGGSLANELAALEGTAGSGAGGAWGGLDAAWGVNPQGFNDLNAATGPEAFGTSAGELSPGGAFDMGGSAGVFDSSGNPLYTSPAVGGETALSRILNGSATSDDWFKVAGAAAPGLLQAVGNYQSGNAIKDLAGQQKSQFDQFQAMGAPYRQRLSDLYSNPGAYLSSPEVQIPVQQGTDALARALSAKVGNPIENMTALGELQNYSANQLYGRLGQEKDRLAGFGGLSAYNQAGAGAPLATQLAQLGIGADAGIWGGLGRAAGDVFNPAPTTITDLLKQMQGNNIFRVT